MALNYYSPAQYSGGRAVLNKARGSLIYPLRTGDGVVAPFVDILADINSINSAVAGLQTIYAIYWNAHFEVTSFPTTNFSQFNSFPTKYKFGSYNWSDSSSYREGGFISFERQYTETTYFVIDLGGGSFLQSPLTTPTGRIDSFNVSASDRAPFTGSGSSVATDTPMASQLYYALSGGVNATIGVAYHALKMWDSIGSLANTRGMQI